MEKREVANSEIASCLKAMRNKNPLVHCITNEVVQEITANVLLAAGASPAMVISEELSPGFAKIASVVSINLGTMVPYRLKVIEETAEICDKEGVKWVLDPVAAGNLPWMDSKIPDILKFHPTVIRGNASEIMSLAGVGHGGKGVDTVNTSDEALESAVSLAQKCKNVVVVTGKTDYITDGKRILFASGGNPLITKVVGTGCSLSSLVGAFICCNNDPVVAAAACCAYVNQASDQAFALSEGPGSFHNNYLDALYNIKPEDFLHG